MNIDKALQEMARELLPNVSSEDDKKIIKELKKLYKKDRMEFNAKLRRINAIRKSEGLEKITTDEIVKGYTEKAVKQEEGQGDRKESLRFDPSDKEYDNKIALYAGNEKIGMIYTQTNEFIPNNKGKTIKHKIIGREVIFPEFKQKIVFKGKDAWPISVKRATLRKM